MDNKILNENVLEKVAGGAGDTNDYLYLEAGTRITFKEDYNRIYAEIVEVLDLLTDCGLTIRRYSVRRIDGGSYNTPEEILSDMIRSVEDIGG